MGKMVRTCREDMHTELQRDSHHHRTRGRFDSYGRSSTEDGRRDAGETLRALPLSS